MAKFEGGLVRWMSFTADGHQLLYADELMRIGIFDIEKVRRISELVVKGHAHSTLKAVAFSRDGATAMTSDLFGNKVIIWNLATGRERSRIEVKDAKGITLALSPDGRLLATGSNHSTQLWDWQKRQKLLEFRHPETKTTALVFDPDGLKLFTGMDDGTVLVWDVSPAYGLLD